MNHEERLATIEQQCQTVMGPLRGIPGLTVTMLDNVIGHQPFGVQISVDPAAAGMTAQDVVDKLKAGDPPVWTRVREGESDIVIHGFGMSEGQDKIVGERIAALFGR